MVFPTGTRRALRWRRERRCGCVTLADISRRHPPGVALVRHGRTVPRPPVFYGRSLAPASLEAVASGQWTSDDKGLLCAVQHQVEAACLRRVPRGHRFGLRRALRATTLPPHRGRCLREVAGPQDLAGPGLDG